MDCELCYIRALLELNGRYVSDPTHCVRCHKTIESGKTCSCYIKSEIMCYMLSAIALGATAGLTIPLWL